LSFGFRKTNLENGIAVVVTAKAVVNEVSLVETISEVLLVPFENKDNDSPGLCINNDMTIGIKLLY